MAPRAAPFGAKLHLGPIGAALLASVYLATVAASPPAASSPLDVGIYAPWPTFASSLLAEAAEFMAAEDGEASSALFWSFHAASMARASENLVADAAEATRAALDLSKPLLSSMTESVLRLSLAARAFSPALEMVRQLGLASPGHAACGAGSAEAAWAEIDGAVACDPGQLRAVLAARSPSTALPAPLLPGGKRECCSWCVSLSST